MSLKYLLDTNIFSELMRPVPNPKVVKNVADFQYFENLKIENWFESGDNL